MSWDSPVIVKSEYLKQIAIWFNHSGAMIPQTKIYILSKCEYTHKPIIYIQ